MNIRRTLYLLAALAVVAITGCEETPSDPGNEAIMAEWKATRIGEAFSPASELELHFESGGNLHGKLGTMDITGTYSTSGSSATSSIRQITLDMTLPLDVTLVGIYQVDGNKLTLEVVPDNANDDITPPDAAAGFGSTKDNGTAAGNRYMSNFDKM